MTEEYNALVGQGDTHISIFCLGQRSLQVRILTVCIV